MNVSQFLGQEDKSFAHPNLRWLALSTKLYMIGEKHKGMADKKVPGFSPANPVKPSNHNIIGDTYFYLSRLARMEPVRATISAFEAVPAKNLADHERLSNITMRLWNEIGVPNVKKPAFFKTTLDWYAASGAGIEEFWDKTLIEISELDPDFKKTFGETPVQA